MYEILILLRHTISGCLFIHNSSINFWVFLYAAAYSKYINTATLRKIKNCERSRRQYRQCATVGMQESVNFPLLASRMWLHSHTKRSIHWDEMKRVDYRKTCLKAKSRNFSINLNRKHKKLRTSDKTTEESFNKLSDAFTRGWIKLASSQAISLVVMGEISRVSRESATSSSKLWETQVPPTRHIVQGDIIAAI
jgi:hypothetical protein